MAEVLPCSSAHSPLLDEAAQTIELIDSQGSHSVVSRDQLESS